MSIIFLKKNAYVLRKNRLAFAEDPDSFADLGSFSKVSLLLVDRA